MRTNAWKVGMVGLAAAALLVAGPRAGAASTTPDGATVEVVVPSYEAEAPAADGVAPAGDAVAPAQGDVVLEGEVEVVEVEVVEIDGLELEIDQQTLSFPDPLEPLNRRTLRVNQTVDRWVLSPVTRAYGFVMPDRAKQSVRDFFQNLESPAIFVNDVLQGELGDAATTVARFSVNTVLGVAGLFDPASSLGLERHSADFGQTLARNGVGSGPYLIVPLLGPTTVRDGIGTLVDVALQPTIYLLGPAPLLTATVQEGTNGITLREAHGADLERLEQGSVDYYAALRSAYYQDRMADLAEPSVTATPSALTATSATPDATDGGAPPT